jgi:hypothetical protein
VDIRAKEDALNTFNTKISLVEDDFKSWVRVQLPRLVSGLPVSEDCIADYYDDTLYGPTSGAGVSVSGNNMPGLGLFLVDSNDIIVLLSSGGPIAAQLQQQMGLDRTYALTQAVCAIKAQQSVQELKISSLRDTNAILKERNQTLEAVLVQWKREIESIHTLGGSSSTDPVLQAQAAADTQQQYIQLYTLKAETDIALQHRITELTQRLQECEEANIEVNSKLAYANDRSLELQALFDTVAGDEHKLKHKTSQSITKLRLELENQHALELKKLRQAYEQEKSSLVRELNAVNHAVVEAEEEARAERANTVPIRLARAPTAADAAVAVIEPVKNGDGSPSSSSSSSTSSSPSSSSTYTTSSPHSGTSSSYSSSSSSSSSSSPDSRGRPNQRRSPRSRSGSRSGSSSSSSSSSSRSSSASSSTRTPPAGRSKQARHVTDDLAAKLSHAVSAVAAANAKSHKTSTGRHRHHRKVSSKLLDTRKVDKKLTKYEEKGIWKQEFRKLWSKYELEKRKSSSARKEVDELSQLLTAQRVELEKHIGVSAAAAFQKHHGLSVGTVFCVSRV